MSLTAWNLFSLFITYNYIAPASLFDFWTGNGGGGGGGAYGSGVYGSGGASYGSTYPTTYNYSLPAELLPIDTSSCECINSTLYDALNDSNNGKYIQKRRRSKCNYRHSVFY